MFTFAISTEHSVPVRGPRQGDWTHEDWEALAHENGNRYEIIDGVLYVSTSPSLFHNWIIRRLDKMIGTPAEDAGLGFVGIIEVGVFMPGCDPVQPDFFFISSDKTASTEGAKHIYGVPDLIIEVLSPGNPEYDLDIKLRAYEKAGVPEYAVVNAARRRVLYYRLVDGAYGDAVTLAGEQLLSFACLPNIAVRVASLFEGAPSTQT
jgi:Uma2 family endonuclease